MAAEKENTVEALLKGMENFITTKTVVGEAITIADTVILPLAEVSFGLGAGTFSQESNNNAGGIGGKITPSAVLIIKDGTSKLVNIKQQDGLTKILDMVPDIVDKFTEMTQKEKEDKEADK